jgi:Flp pilus assembly pilin Flp
MAIGARRERRRTWRAIAVQLIRDDRGQDLLEYALLSAFIGVAGLAVMNAMGVSLANAYTAWGNAVDALWETPEPAMKAKS